MSLLPSHYDFNEILTCFFLSNLLRSHTLSRILIPMVFSFVPLFFALLFPYCVYSYLLWCALSQKSKCSHSSIMVWTVLLNRNQDAVIRMYVFYLDGNKGCSM